MKSIAGFAACLTAVAVGAVGCSSGSTTAGGSTAAASGSMATGGGLTASSVPSALARFYDQKLTWGHCQTDLPVDAGELARFQCADLTVPLAYTDPGGQTIKVALNRLSASDPAHRIGSLLTNPGGPGGSGLGLVYSADETFTPQVRADYDIIGMDPRGVGQSGEITCAVTTQETTDKDEAAQARDFVQGCEQRSGNMLANVRTDYTARDLDVARAVLGDKKLNYLGFSYGTVLGQYYAEMFPRNVGRMVLDSVANPAAWPSDPTAQAVGFEDAFKVMVQRCTEQHSCPLGTSDSAALTKFDDMLTKAVDSPLPTRNGTPPVSAMEILAAVRQAAYSESSWPSMDKTLAIAFSGDGTPFRPEEMASAADQSPSASAATHSSSASPGAEAAMAEESGSFDAILCPHVPQADRTVAYAREAGKQAEQAAPHFSFSVESTLLKCAYWPVPSLPQAGKALRAEGTPPILVTANIHDGATPVAWARQVHNQLASSVLVTNDSGGHGFYSMGDCTKKVTDDYLLHGTLPQAGTECHDRFTDAPPRRRPAASPLLLGRGSRDTEHTGRRRSSRDVL